MRLSNPKLTPEEKDALKGRIFDELGLPHSEPEPAFGSGGRWSVRVNRGVAAAILIVLTVPLFFLIRKNTTGHSNPAIAQTVVKTGSGETRKVVLPDSSVVLLNAGSVLTWQTNFLTDTGRSVALEGNAFFSVRKMPGHKSFTVHTRSLAIAVLGTEFNVNARTAATEVALVRGKVNVSRAGESKVNAVLLPGEEIRLDTSKSQLVRSGITENRYSAWTENKWNFSRARLGDILSLVEEYYGVHAVFEKEQRKGLKMTASITVGSMEDLLSVIENTLQIKIDSQNNELLVH